MCQRLADEKYIHTLIFTDFSLQYQLLTPLCIVEVCKL